MAIPCNERDGTKRAEFEDAVLVHLDALYNLALRMTREPFAAEDLVQDTMVRAYRFFGRYQKGTNCKAWLFAILRNAFINRYRSVEKEPRHVSFHVVEEMAEGALPSSFAAEARNPEESMADGRLGEALRSALDGLGAEFRMVAVLSFVEGYSYKEIASIMSCPIGTVMSRVHRARRLLQQALQGHARERGLLDRIAIAPFAASAQGMESPGLQLSAG